MKAMNPRDKDKIEQIVEDRNWAHQSLLGKGSATYRAFLDMQKAAFADGAVDKLTKELIATAISVAINCESCMEWHIHQALLAGASEKQILEAIDVSMEMGGGPATVSARFALKVLEYHQSSRSG